MTFYHLPNLVVLFEEFSSSVAIMKIINERVNEEKVSKISCCQHCDSVCIRCIEFEQSPSYIYVLSEYKFLVRTFRVLFNSYVRKKDVDK